MQDRKRETADALQNVGGDSSRKRRAITHTFIIIALSGTAMYLSGGRPFFFLAPRDPRGKFPNKHFATPRRFGWVSDV